MLGWYASRVVPEYVGWGFEFPSAGRCTELFPPTGLVIEQIALWTRPNVGITTVPLILGINDGAYVFYEQWHDLPSVLGPRFGSGYGKLIFTTAIFNQSLSCLEEFGAETSTSSGPFGPSTPNTTFYLNVAGPEEILVVLHTDPVSPLSLSVLWRRLVGPKCIETAQILLADLRKHSGVPLLMDVEVACSWPNIQ